MIHLTTSAPFIGEIKTLKLIGHLGIGAYRDEEGNSWDVYDYIGGTHTKDGEPIIHARMVNPLCPKDSTALWDTHKGYKVEYLPYHIVWVN